MNIGPNIEKIKDIVSSEKKEFLIYTHRMLFPKIREDITYILRKRWAKEISKEDMDHVHVCVPWELQIPDELHGAQLVRFIIERTVLLYHSQENTGILENRNLISRFKDPPILIILAEQ